MKTAKRTSDEAADSRTAVGLSASCSRLDLRTPFDEYERQLIRVVLDTVGGHQRRAVAKVGLLPSTLSTKMRRLGLRSQHRSTGAPDDLTRTS
jgi:DNA-binding NtrC family response regulator